MPFTPLTNYTGYNHVPVAGAVWIHPKNGNAYCCACEKDQGSRQDLSVYRMRGGSSSWELVKRYEGTVDSTAQITMGGAAIGQGGHMLVVTSLIIPGAPKITAEGFQGVWIRENNIDEPWGITGNDPRVDALTSQLEALGQQIVAIETALANIGQGGGAGLTPEQAQALAWVAGVRAALRG